MFSGLFELLGCIVKVWLDYQPPKNTFKQHMKTMEDRANQGDVEALLFLGKTYYDGIGVEVDYDKAIKRLRKAAEQGSSIAQLRLSTAYFEGKGVEKNVMEAEKWYRIATKTTQQ